MSDKRRLVVLGLDGASFELLDPWINDGSLPNIARMRSSGAWADMESCLPPVTSPNWKCYSTGLNPGNLGVYWWETVDVRARTIKKPSALNYTAREIWDYLSEAGKRCGVINMPTTYPPRAVNGCMVSGGPDAFEKGYTWPASLEAELARDYGYRVHPRNPDISGPHRKDIVADIYGLIRKRFEFGLKLIAEGYDFVQITLFYINALQHFFWDDDDVKGAWLIVDEYLGRILDDGGLTVLIMSDHGSNRIRTTFYINSWLEKNGYLVVRKARARALKGMGLTRERLVSTLASIGLAGYARAVLPRWLKSMFPTSSGEVKKEGKAQMLDWERSSFVASGQGPVYCLRDEGRDELVRELAGRLSGLTFPGSSEPLFRNVYLKSDVYWGGRTDTAPDIVLDQGKGLHIHGGVGVDEIFGGPDRWQAENKLHGLFMLAGPGIRKGVRLDGVRIIDLAPTVLHMLLGGSPRLDGRVLSEAFEEAGEVVYTGGETSLPGEERAGGGGDEDEVAERLRDLGYL